MAYSHLLFDFDHTLFDTDQSEALSFAQALSAHGVAEPQRYLEQYQAINQGLWRGVEAGIITPNELKSLRFEMLAEELGFDYDANSVAEAYGEGLVACGELYPGAFELIRDLSRVFTLGMVTNGLGPVQRGRLDRVGLADAFTSLVISGEVGVAKPRSEIFQFVFDQFPAIDTAAYLMVGDSLVSDIQGGLNAGIDTCWFNRHGHGSDVPATHEIQQLNHLRTVVD